VKQLLFICLVAIVLAIPVSAKITLPTAEQFTLNNGLTVLVIQRPQLPLFSLKLTCRGGSIYDPAGKEGLAALANEMLMRGTATRTAKQIADEIAFGGGTLQNECGNESAGFEGEFLSAQVEKSFEILADMILHSTFAADEFDKTKARTRGDLQGRRENPATVANDAVRQEILGASRFSHFSGGLPTTVEPLTRDDVALFVKSHYTPDNCVLVVCGDIAPASVRQWAKKYFGKWAGKAVLIPIETAFPAVTGRDVVIYDKPDASQTQIRIGGSGMPLNHPDFPALEVVRTVYGGSFASRLMDEIRVNRGLTYGVSCRSQQFKPGGLVYVQTFTKNATVGEVVDIVLAEALKMQTEMVSDSELTDGANFRSGTYPLEFETNGSLAGVFTDMWVNGLNKSYYEDFQERLKAVTPQQAMDAANKYFAKDHYRLILVGKADDIRTQAEKYGPVTVLPFSEK
jgi:zinc protease